MIRSILFVAVVISLLWIGFSGIVSDGVPVQANKADQQQTVKKGISEERLKRLIERLEPRDPTKLYGRQLEIASGKTDLPAWKVWCYREKWGKAGKQLPEWVNGPKEFPGRTIVLREGKKPPMSCEEIRSWLEENGVTYKEYNCGECDCCEPPEPLTCEDFIDYCSQLASLHVEFDTGCAGSVSVDVPYNDTTVDFFTRTARFSYDTSDETGRPSVGCGAYLHRCDVLVSCRLGTDLYVQVTATIANSDSVASITKFVHINLRNPDQCDDAFWHNRVPITGLTPIDLEFDGVLDPSSTNPVEFDCGECSVCAGSVAHDFCDCATFNITVTE